MLLSISLLTLLLATFVPVLASPAVAHAPPIPDPRFNPHAARGIDVLPLSPDPETNGTLVKRDWKTTCKGVTLCTEEDFKGTCMSWCYEPDKFENLFARATKDLRSVRLEKGADCWFVKMNTCTKFNIQNRPMIFMTPPGGNIPLQVRGTLGCFICPSEKADYLM